jgi:hypothetical protein
MKICSKCGLEKDFSEFHKFKHSKDGLKSQCKSCVLEKEKERRSTDEYKQKQKEYNQSIPKEIKSNYRKSNFIKNKESILQKNKEWRENNKDYISEYSKKYREENKEILSEYKKIYYNENKEEISIKKKKWREENKDYMSEYNKIWRENNTEKVIENRKKYMNSKSYKSNKKRWYKLNKEKNPHVLAWRCILTNSLKRLGKKKEDETIKLLGYSAIELKEYIESLFVEDMSWDNYGEWHIDHIKPVSSYDSDTPVDVVNNLENLQPLWAFDNLSKGNKYKK